MLVRGEQDRLGRPRTVLGRQRIDAKVTPADTAGDLYVIEHVDDVRGGPSRHVHHAQDEWFYVLAGAYVVEVGEDRFELGPGDSVLAPRGVPHVWGYAGEGRGRMLIAFQPAGLMEPYLAALADRGRTLSPEDHRALAAAHGMTVVGPPLAV